MRVICGLCCGFGLRSVARTFGASASERGGLTRSRPPSVPVPGSAVGGGGRRTPRSSAESVGALTSRKTCIYEGRRRQ